MKNAAKCILTVCALCGLSMSEKTTAEDAYWRTRPGGLASVDYQFPKEPKTATQTGYYNIDFFFEVTEDPGNVLSAYSIPRDVIGDSSAIGYYWANQFGFTNSGNAQDGYLGLQTVGSIDKASSADRKNPSANVPVKSCRLAIFSIWNALDAKSGGPKSYVAPYGHEGSGWSCKVEYPWQAGKKYRIRLYELKDANTPSAPEWWRAMIKEVGSDKEVVIGDIQVPGNWGWLHSRPHMFTEYFSSVVNQTIGDADDGKNAPRICQYMPKATIRISPPTANRGEVQLSKMTPRAYGKCASVAQFRSESSGSQLASGITIDPQVIVNETGTLRHTGAAPTLRIVRVECLESSESGEDEIYIKISNGSRFPKRDARDIDDGEHWDLNQPITLGDGDTTIELWEEDDTSKDDLLGTLKVSKADVKVTGSEKSQSMTGDDGRYVFVYRYE